MFGNCFFPLFSVFIKKKILFLRLKNLFDNPKWNKKTKTVLRIQFLKETENMQNAVFNF